MVTPPRPRGSIMSSKQSVYFRPREITDQSLVGPFDGDGQYSCGDADTDGIAEGNHPAEGADGSESNVSGLHLIAALSFYVIQKLENGGSIDIKHDEGGRFLSGRFAEELKQ